jgi:hypothetical protein
MEQILAVTAVSFKWHVVFSRDVFVFGTHLNTHLMHICRYFALNNHFILIRERAKIATFSFVMYANNRRTKEPQTVCCA